MFGGDLRGDPTEKLCFSGSVLGDEALPFPAEGQPCFSAVLTPPFTGAFLIVLCPPPWQPPAAPVPAHSQGRTQVKGLAALHVTLTPSTIQSGHISWAWGQLRAHLRIRVPAGPELPEGRLGQQKHIWAVKPGEPQL